MPRTIISELLGTSQSGRTTLASKLGKKGTSSDVTLYNHQKKSLTIIDPHKYPQNIIPLVQFLEMSDVNLLLLPPNPIDKFTAELSIIGNTYTQKPVLIVQTMKDKVTNIELEHYWAENRKKLHSFKHLFEYPPIQVDQNDGNSITILREKILEIGSNTPLYNSDDDEDAIILVDHAFPVKGVGTVVLGKVISGTVRKGMNLLSLPHKTNLVIRSIQVQDVDVKEANKGTRVGLAIKGQFTNIRRGEFLIGKNIAYELTQELEVENYKQAPFTKEINELKQVHLVHGTNDFPAKVKSEGNKVFLKIDKPVPIIPQLPIFVLDLGGKQRFNGIIEVKD